MGWALKEHEHKVFKRNPLVSVVVEIRFHPVLKIAERVADLQERLRPLFPVFRQTMNQFVNVNPFGAVDVRPDNLFHFERADASAGFALSTSFLTFETKAHVDRAATFADVMVGIDALVDLCKPVLTRVGIRYVDIIDRELVASELGRKVEWSEVMTSGFLQVPSGLADLNNTLFANEVTSTLPSGAMTLRFGLLPDPADGGRAKFRFDTDRYLETTGTPSDLRQLLDAFATDVYSVFLEAMGPALREWMEKGE